MAADPSSTGGDQAPGPVITHEHDDGTVTTVFDSVTTSVLDDGNVSVKPGYLFPRGAIVLLSYGPSGTDLKVSLKWSSETLSYNIDRLEVVPESGKLTARNLVSIALEQVAQMCIQYVLVKAKNIFPTTFAKPEHLMEIWKVSDDEVRLNLIANVYALERAYGKNQLKECADAFGISRSTATRWVARARREGLLD